MAVILLYVFLILILTQQFSAGVDSDSLFHVVDGFRWARYPHLHQLKPSDVYFKTAKMKSFAISWFVSSLQTGVCTDPNSIYEGKETSA